MLILAVYTKSVCYYQILPEKDTASAVRYLKRPEDLTSAPFNSIVWLLQIHIPDLGLPLVPIRSRFKSMDALKKAIESEAYPTVLQKA